MDNKLSDHWVIDSFVRDYKWPKEAGALKTNILNKVIFEKIKESNWKDILCIVFSKSYPLMVVMILSGVMLGMLAVPQTGTNARSSVYDNAYFLSAEMGLLYNKENIRD